MVPVIRGNSLYKTATSTNYGDSKTQATSYGGNLAAIENASENAFLVSTYAPDYWCLYAGGKGNPRRWENDTEMSFTNWQPGQDIWGYNVKLILKTTFASWETGWFQGGWQGTPYDDVVNPFGAKRSIGDPTASAYLIEIPLTSSITFSSTPKEGAGVFTTSINLSAGTASSGNLAEGATVYWKVSGITADDLATGGLTGSGTISNGKLVLQHSLNTDADTGESFEISVFSDAGMTQQVGITKSNGIQEAHVANSSKSISLERVWTKLLGTPDEEGAWTVTTDKNNAIYIAGTTLGNLDGLTNNGWYDGFLTKYTSDGSKQWTKLVGTSRQEGIYSVAASDDEFLCLAGHTGSDALVAKYSFDGTEQWRKSLGSGSWDAAWSIALSPSGDIYVAGNTEGSFDGQVNKGADDGFLTKYDAGGNKIWTRFIGTPHADHYADNLVTTSDGSIYIGGTTRGNLDGQVNSGGSDAYLSKFNSDGTRQWTRLIGTTEDDAGSIVKPLSDGSLVVIGSTKGDLGGHANNGNYDIFINKYSSDGTQVWSKLIGGSGNDFASDLISVGSDTYVTGFTDGSIDGIAENKGGRDAFVLAFDSEWEWICANQFGTSRDDGASEIASSSDGTIYILGNTGGNLHDQENQGNQDAFLIKFRAINSALETDTPPPALQSTVATSNQLILAFSEDIQIAGGGTLNPAYMTVTVDGQTRKVITSQVTGSQLTLTLSWSPLNRASSISVSYNPPTNGSNQDFITDLTGNKLAAITSQAVDTFSTSTNISRSGIGSAYENLILTGSAPIIGYGNTQNNTIAGNDGNNTLDGLAGSDTMLGGLGDDTYVVDNNSDLITELASAGTDTVRSSIDYTLADNLENLMLLGSAAINGTGNAANNILTGNSAANILNGNGGTDNLIGGRGSDIYIVDSRDDSITETGSSSDIDSVQSSLSWLLGTNLEDLTLTGTSAINGTGNEEDNTLIGNSANNILDGGNGGTDRLTGLAGADAFRFSSRPSGFRNASADHITDFSSAQGDKIQIAKSAFGITASTATLSVVSGDAALNTALSGSALFVYNAANGELHWNQNGTTRGAGTGGVLAILDNKATLSAGDLLLV